MVKTIPHAGPLYVYMQLAEKGAINKDSAQIHIVHQLQNLHVVLGDYRARGPFPMRQWFSTIRRMTPKGLYLWGGVGRGKTMLMDLFYDNADVPNKRRVHFHAFMRDVHQRIHIWRTTGVFPGQCAAGMKSAGHEDGDPLPVLADVLSREASLLCFDEMQVTDIADAMILSRLFEYLFKFGVVVVATSNRQPIELYKDGLNRPLFLPFIDLISEQMRVMELQSETDYRLEFLSHRPVYFTPLGPDTDITMDAMFKEMVASHHIEPHKIVVAGRDVVIPLAAHGIGRTNFDALCANPLGASDYIAIARCFHTLFIDHIPAMGPENCNESRRFLTLVDTLYEHRVKLVASAAVEVEQLYPVGNFSFEFERTVSRLIEMRSSDYVALEHKS